ncbi:MAG: hypothetical protein ACOH5I_20660 [Oligoflexus sp.]
MELATWIRTRRDQLFAHTELLLVLAAVFLASPDRLSVSIGLIPFLLGIALKIWSLGYAPAGKELGDVGPYRFLRYPSVLSTLLTLIGIVFAARSFPLAVIVIAWSAVQASMKVRWQIIEGHGSEDVSFPRYQAMVPALIPNLLPYSKAGGEAFNWRLILHEQHRAWVQTLVTQILAYIWFSVVLLEPFWAQYTWVAGIALSLFTVWQSMANRSQWKQVKP